MTIRSFAAAVIVVLLLAGCNQSKPAPSAGEAFLTALNTPPADPHWLEVEIEGVELGLWVPPGWVADVQDGLILAEHFTTLQSGDQLFSGMVVYIFVPSLDTFEIPADLGDDHNMAWMVLSQAINKPEMLGSAAASEPQAFTWGAHNAAYYLLTNPDGMQTLVMGIALPSRRLLVLNLSAPPEYVPMREAVTALLDGITVDGVMLHSADLTALPANFDFPARPTPESGN